MRKTRGIILATMAVLMALAMTAGTGLASSPTTNVFHGTATSGPDGIGLDLPITLTAPPVIDADLQMHVSYMYTAEGTARGGVPGSFEYEEHGRLTIDVVKQELVDHELLSAVFTIYRNGNRGVVTVADTLSEPYQSGVVVESRVSELPAGAMRSLSQVKALLPKGGNTTYGFFTFNTDYGTHTGYATPDFTEFAIELTFDR